MPTLDISCSLDDGGELRLAVSGELDLSNRDVLTHALDGARAAGLRRVILDFGELAFIDCGALRVIEDAAGRFDGLAITGSEGMVRWVLELGGLDRFFEPVALSPDRSQERR